MKVVQINCSAHGSTGNIAKAIHRTLLEMGEESYLFYGIGVSTQKNMFRIGNDFALHSHAVLSRNLGRQGYFSLFSTKKLIQQLKKLQPDVIHLHNLHGSYLHLPALFSYLKRSQAKIVLTLHDCWLFTGKCPHFTEAGCYKWKEACGHCPQLSIYPRSKVDTTAKCLADKKKWFRGFGDRLQIVAVSNWLRDTAKQSFLGEYPIRTVYNGVNTEAFHPVDSHAAEEKYGIGKEKFVILGVASVWDDRKGLKQFVDLSQKLTDSDVIVLVGLNDGQIEALPPNIIGIRRTENQAELAQLYSRADVFVNPSKEETFGLVTAEAIACGTPAVVYRSTACAEVLMEQNGIALETGDTDLLSAVRKVKKEGFQGELLSSEMQMVQNYISLYLEGLH